MIQGHISKTQKAHAFGVGKLSYRRAKGIYMHSVDLQPYLTFFICFSFTLSLLGSTIILAIQFNICIEIARARCRRCRWRGHYSSSQRRLHKSKLREYVIRFTGTVFHVEDWVAHVERPRISHDGDSIDSLGKDWVVHVVNRGRVHVAGWSFCTAIAESSDA